MKKLLPLLLLLSLPLAGQSQSASKTAGYYLSYQPHRTAIASAHRGGRFLPGYPENALETFAFVAPQLDGIIECDINMTKDSVLILMHDSSLGRTTTGTGKVREKDWAYISGLRLVDDYGHETPYRVPQLGQILEWSKGQAVLSLDVKRGVPFEKVAAAIEKAKAEGYVSIIAYSLKDAQLAHHLNPELFISVGIRNEEELKKYLESGIPTSRMVAFTGVYERSADFYEALHEQGIACIIGTIGNIDNKAIARSGRVYIQLFEKGVDIFATDYPLQVQQVLEEYSPGDMERR